jgi:hypothetical protein
VIISVYYVHVHVYALSQRQFHRPHSILQILASNGKMNTAFLQLLFFVSIYTHTHTIFIRLLRRYIIKHHFRINIVTTVIPISEVRES